MPKITPQANPKKVEVHSARLREDFWQAVDAYGFCNAIEILALQLERKTLESQETEWLVAAQSLLGKLNKAMEDQRRGRTIQ